MPSRPPTPVEHQEEDFQDTLPCRYIAQAAYIFETILLVPVPIRLGIIETIAKHGICAEHRRQLIENIQRIDTIDEH